MGTMTLAIPDELLQRMRLFQEIKWSHIARQAIAQRLNDLEAIEKLASKSKLTKKDVDEIDRKIKKAATLKFLNESRN